MSRHYGSQPSSVPGRVIGTALGFGAAWLALSLATVGGTGEEGVSWVVGSAGRGLSSILSYVFGLSACLLPILIGFWGYNRFVGADMTRETRLSVFLLFETMILMAAANVVSGLGLTDQAGLLSGGLSLWSVNALGPLGSLFMLAAMAGVLKVATDVGVGTLRGNILLKWSLPVVEWIAGRLKVNSRTPVSRYLPSLSDSLSKRIASIVAVFVGLWLASGIAGGYRFVGMGTRDLAEQELGWLTDAVSGALIGALGHFTWVIPVSLVVIGYAGLRKYNLTIAATRAVVLGYFVWSTLFLGTVLTETAESNLSGGFGRGLALSLSNYIGQTGVVLATLSLCAILVLATRSKIFAGFASGADRDMATGAFSALSGGVRSLGSVFSVGRDEAGFERGFGERFSEFFSSFGSRWREWNEERRALSKAKSEERRAIKEARLKERQSIREAKLEEKEALRQAKIEERAALKKSKASDRSELKAAKREEQLQKKDQIAGERERRLKEAEELRAQKQAELEAQRSQREQNIAERKAQKRKEIEDRKAEKLARIEEKRAQREAMAAERQAKRDALIMEKKAREDEKIAERTAQRQAKLDERKAKQEAKAAEKQARQEAKLAQKEAREEAKLAKKRRTVETTLEDSRPKSEAAFDEAGKDEKTELEEPAIQHPAPIRDEEQTTEEPVSEGLGPDDVIVIHELPSDSEEPAVKTAAEDSKACVNHVPGGEFTGEIGDLDKHRREAGHGSGADMSDETRKSDQRVMEPSEGEEAGSGAMKSESQARTEETRGEGGRAEEAVSGNIVPFPKPKPRKKRRLSFFGQASAGRVSRRRLQTKRRPSGEAAAKPRLSPKRILTLCSRAKKKSAEDVPAIKAKSIRHPAKQTSFADIWIQAKSTVVIVVVGTVVLTIGYFALVSPAEDELAELSTLRGAAQEYYLLNAIQRTVGLFWDRTLEEDEESEVPKHMTEMAKEAGLRVDSDATRGASEKVNKQIDYTNYSMELSGTYSQLMEFMKSMEDYPVFLSVNSMELTGDGSGRVHAVLEVHGYTFNADGQD